MQNKPTLKKTMLSKVICATLSLTITFTSIASNASTLATGEIADTNTSALQQAVMRAAFSAPLSMVGNRETDPGTITLLGARVTGLDSCDGDIGLSLTNSFTDGTLMKIYENFESIIEAVVSTGGLIYLATLYIQKSNPGLYNLLKGGINIGITDFTNALGSCESMLAAASSYIPDSATEAGKIDYTEQAIKNAKDNGIDMSDIDIVDFMSSSPNDTSPEDIVAKGKTFYDENGVSSTVAGEDSENPVAQFIKPGMAIGYCLLRGVDKDDCDAEGKHQEANSAAADIVEHPMFSIIFGDDEDEYMSEIQDLAVKIYGEIYYTDCEDCTATNVAGEGLQRYFESQTTDIYSLISTSVDSSLNALTSAKIDAMSAPYSIIVNSAYIRTMKLYDDRESIQEWMMLAIATEVAYYRTIYVSTLFGEVFQAMMNDETTINAKFQGQYKTFLERNRAEYKSFVAKAASMDYHPGYYSRIILSMADGNGNIDTTTSNQILSR